MYIIALSMDRRRIHEGVNEACCSVMRPAPYRGRTIHGKLIWNEVSRYAVQSGRDGRDSRLWTVPKGTAAVGMKHKNGTGLGWVAGAAILLAGCSSEIGRRPMDSDISCLRAQMGAELKLSFPLAANTCQRMTDHNFVIGTKNPKPIPLNLHGAPDLQTLADQYGYSYTR